MKQAAPQCARCAVLRCRTRDKEQRLPDFCPTGNFPDIVAETLAKHQQDAGFLPGKQARPF